MTTTRNEDDFRVRLLQLKADPSTPLEQVAAEAKAAGWKLRSDHRGGIAPVPAACHPTIARIRAAMLRGGL